MGVKLTTEEFITRVKKIHGDRYDYSKVNYISLDKKVLIIDENGFEHTIRPDNLISGNKLNIRSVIKKEDYLTHKFNTIHQGKYSYYNLNYKNGVVTITCNTHGNFTQTVDNHLKGKGCPKCKGKNKTTSDIIIEFNKIHKNKYDYSLVKYNGIKNKVTIICPKHGNFNQTPEEHINGCGCPICKTSKGEKYIAELLDSNNIKYIPQHRFQNCKNILPLPFDFYLPDFNTCIEYHGEQHYRPIQHFGGIKKFNLTKKRDAIKKEYCDNNWINLIIVPFNQTSKLDITKLTHNFFNLV